MRLALVCLALGCPLGIIARAADASGIRVTEIVSPAAPHSLGAALTTAPNGTLWLSWVEPGSSASVASNRPAEHHHSDPAPSVVATLRFATLDAASGAWAKPSTIVSDRTLTTNAADFPQLAIAGNGTAFAVWTDGHGGARMSESHDRGSSWSKPKPWASESIAVEKFSLARLADGRVLAAWLDDRGRKAGGKTQQLFTRIVGNGDGEERDRLVDASVCDCCQTALTPFLDGGALLAYRGRTTDEVRDINVARLRSKGWEEPRPLSRDEWRIDACPVNGPRVASDGSRVGAAWFTAADNEPRVLVSFSPDAGARWLAPLRIDRGHPAGHVDALLLRDGAIVVTWLEMDGSLWLQRITPEFSATDAVELAPKGTVAVRSVPRMALLRDYAGAQTSAQLLVAYTREAEPVGVRTLTVTIPEGQLLTTERHCDCAPTAEQLQGFAIRGVVVAVDVATNTVRVRHGEIPGVFEAGTHEFKVAGSDLATVQPQKQFLGLIERSSGHWRLYDVRVLEAQ